MQNKIIKLSRETICSLLDLCGQSAQPSEYINDVTVRTLP